MKVIHFLFTLGNIISFTLIAYNVYLGFVIGIISAIIGIRIFYKDFWLMITQIFYLIINLCRLLGF
jgi:hypothetical protein